MVYLEDKIFDSTIVVRLVHSCASGSETFDYITYLPKKESNQKK